MKRKLAELKSDRDFQLWEYLVSHGQLLIRSPSFGRTNIDVEFFAVEYVSLPHYLKGIEILDPTAEEDHFFRELVARLLHKNVKVHVLMSEGKRHYVVGILRGMFENDWEPFESPLYAHHYYHGLDYPSGRRTVNIWISEPWDWVTLNGGGPFEGYVVAANDEYLLAKLRRLVTHRWRICKLMLAKTNNRDVTFRQLESESISASLLPLTEEFVIPGRGDYETLDQAIEIAGHHSEVLDGVIKIIRPKSPDDV